MKGHVAILLMGQHFKNEIGERNPIVPLANKTDGGLCMRKFIHCSTAMLLAEGKGEVVGPAFYGVNGFMIKKSTLNGEQLHVTMHKLVPQEIIGNARFNVYRFFHHGATSTALNLKENKTNNLAKCYQEQYV